ncbi:MAG TPA: hypothetical protein VLX92_04165 [Kofleriaceae bacterium]|nr:hypothetical protein [Kofleriaceae bacterium]
MTAWPRLELRRLANVRPWEYALRFAFGGAIAVAAWLVGTRWTAGGGLLLAFPAIMPASLTLVKQHDGRACAVEDARGGRLATLALACFALVVTITATRWPAACVLAVAALAWIAVAVAAWIVAERRHRPR